MKIFPTALAVFAIIALSGCADERSYPGRDYGKIVLRDEGRDYYVTPGYDTPYDDVPEWEVVYPDRFEAWRWSYGYAYGPWYDPWYGYGWYAPFYDSVWFGFGWYTPYYYYAPWRYPHYPYAYREYGRWHDPRWANPAWRDSHWRNPAWRDGYHGTPNPAYVAGARTRSGAPASQSDFRRWNRTNRNPGAAAPRSDFAAPAGAPVQRSHAGPYSRGAAPSSPGASRSRGDYSPRRDWPSPRRDYSAPRHDYSPSSHSGGGTRDHDRSGSNDAGGKDRKH